jgi:hypothetical protein
MSATKPAEDNSKSQEISKGLFGDAGGQSKPDKINIQTNENKSVFGSSATSSSLFAKKDDKPKEVENKEGTPKTSNALFGGMTESKKDDAPKQDDKPKGGMFAMKSTQPAGGMFGTKPNGGATASIGPGSKSPFLNGKKPEEKNDKPEEKKSVFPPTTPTPANDKKGSLPRYESKKDDKPNPFGSDKKENKPGLFGATKKDENSSPFGAKDGKETKSASIFGGPSTEKDSGDKVSKPIGFSLNEEKKGEEGKSNANPAAPVFKESDVEVIKKISLEKSKMSELDSTTLEDIFTSWYNKVESQSDGYKKHAKKLKKDELALYDNITMLETLKNYSERVIQDYGTSLTTMQDLANQQMVLMKSLDDVEDDIDDVIRKKNQGINTYNRFRGIPGSDNDDFIDRTNYRQQMTGKAHVVNTTLENIDDAIHNLNKALSTSNSNSAQVNEEHSEIGKVLNHSYDSLKWIQDTACDLNFQIELIDNELSQM